MSDPIPQTDGAFQTGRKVVIDCPPTRQDTEQGPGLVGSLPPRICDPMCGQIDTLLNGEK